MTDLGMIRRSRHRCPRLWLMTGILLLLISMLSACGGSLLFSALEERQAVEVEAALLAAGLDANKKPSSDGKAWAITVPKDEFPRAVALLRELGLPRTQNQSMGDVFKKEGFVSSPLEERARYLYALSQELARTLMEIDGVVSARVHVALPERGLLDETKKSASAAVVIIQEPDVDLSRHEIDIKAIITDGVEDLDDVNRVTVKFFSRRTMELLPISPEQQAKSSSPSRMLTAGITGLLLLTGGAGGAGALYMSRRKEGSRSGR
jgi:type III secretion protein J